MKTQQVTKDLKVLGLCFKAGKLGIFIVYFMKFKSLISKEKLEEPIKGEGTLPIVPLPPWVL